MPTARRELAVFVGIGLAAGFFSALFGVGGGIVAVPLLIALAGFVPRLATGTSLAAIALTAFFGVVSYQLLEHVQWAEAAMIGLPAVAGSLFGTWLQQRVSSRVLVLLFAAFMVVVAVRLLLQ